MGTHEGVYPILCGYYGILYSDVPKDAYFFGKYSQELISIIQILAANNAPFSINSLIGIRISLACITSRYCSFASETRVIGLSSRTPCSLLSMTLLTML